MLARNENCKNDLASYLSVLSLAGCVGAKANVKQFALACGWRCFSFAFAKDGKHGLSENCSSVHFLSVCLKLHGRPKVADNGLGLGEGGD